MTGATGSATGVTGTSHWIWHWYNRCHRIWHWYDGSSSNYADDEDNVVDEMKEEILSTKIILPTGPTGGALATGGATGSVNTGSSGSATGATAINILVKERTKLWSAIQKKQAVRKKLQKRLFELKQIMQKRLVQVHEAVTNATLNMKEATQVEREASRCHEHSS